MSSTQSVHETPVVAVRAIKKQFIQFGVGNLFKGFVAELLQAAGHTVVAVRLRQSNKGLGELSQNYTLVGVSDAGVSFREIGAVVEVFDAWSNPQPMVSYMTDPELQVVLTALTLAAFSQKHGKLNLQAESVLHDLAISANDTPAGIYGAVKLALLERYRLGMEQNLLFLLIENGLERLNPQEWFLEFFRHAELGDIDREDFISYFVRTCTFARAVADKIVPNMAPEHVATIVASLDFSGHAVVAESYSGRLAIEYKPGIVDLLPPSWTNGAEARVTIVDDLDLEALRKKYFVNMLHFAMALLGWFINAMTIDEVMKHPLARLFAVQLQREAVPYVGSSDGYGEFADRMANPHLRDPLGRVARNSASKIEFVLNVIHHLLIQEAGAYSLPKAYIAFFAWWLLGIKGSHVADDPIIANLADVHDNLVTLPESALPSVMHELADRLRFDVLHQLADTPVFIDELRVALATMREQGINTSIELALDNQ